MPVQIQSKPTLTIWESAVELLPLAAEHVARMAAAGITATASQKTALNSLNESIAEIGVSKFAALYPLIGGTPGTHALDMIAGRDVTWSGTVTHDSTGITPDGTTGYGATGLVPSVLGTPFALNSFFIGFYQRTPGTPPGVHYDSGAEGPTGVVTITGVRRVDTKLYGRINSNAGGTSPIGQNPQGFFCASRTASNLTTTYRNGVSAYTVASASTALCDRELYIGAYNGKAPSPNLFSSNNYGLFVLGGGLTAGDQTTLSAAVIAFQTSLGRNV